MPGKVHKRQMPGNYSLDYFIIAMATLLQFSVSYGKALEGLDSTTKILIGAKQGNPGNPGRGGRPKSLDAFLITGGIVLALVLAFIVYKFRLWKCRQCRKERREDNTYTPNVETPIPQEEFPDVTYNNQHRAYEEPPEYHIQKYEGESNPSFSTVSLSENNSIPVNDEPPPPPYNDATHSSNVPSINHSSSQSNAPSQFTSS